MSIAYLFLGPEPFNGWALSHRLEFELVSGPRTNFRCYMPIPLFPHHWPKHPEELGNFIVPMHFPQQEEVILAGFIEKKLQPIRFQILLMGRLEQLVWDRRPVELARRRVPRLRRCSDKEPTMRVAGTYIFQYASLLFLFPHRLRARNWGLHLDRW